MTTLLQIRSQLLTVVLDSGNPVNTFSEALAIWMEENYILSQADQNDIKSGQVITDRHAYPFTTVLGVQGSYDPFGTVELHTELTDNDPFQ